MTYVITIIMWVSFVSSVLSAFNPDENHIYRVVASIFAGIYLCVAIWCSLNLWGANI